MARDVITHWCIYFWSYIRSGFGGIVREYMYTMCIDNSGSK